MRQIALRHVATIRASNVDKKWADEDAMVRLCNYMDVYGRDFIRNDQVFMAATATRDQIKAFRLQPGDVVITKDSETANDIGIPALVESSAPDLVCGYHLAIIRPHPLQVDNRFLYWSMAADPAREQLAAAATGVTRFGLRTESISTLILSAPTLKQQRVIASFLDVETARIDLLIERRMEMVKLLYAREGTDIEACILHRSNGEIDLRRLVATPPMYGAAESGEEGTASWPRYIRITDLTSEGALRETGIKRLKPGAARGFMLADGDLLFARSGATAGKAFRYKGEFGPACFASYLIRIRVNQEMVLPGFLELWSRTSHYWSQIHSLTIQATIQNVSADRYMSLRVPKVGPATQSALVARLTRRRSRSAELRTGITQQVALLQERRQALITAAVTGQLEIPGT